MKKTLSIEGMTCQHCVMGVTNALSGVEGVTSVNVDLEGKKADIEAAESVDDQKLKEAVSGAGYSVTAVADG